MTHFNIKYKKNILLFYFTTFFSSMVFHRGIFILFLLQKGITNSQIGVLQLVLFWSIFLLEIPTGLLGDKIGRKWSVLLGFVFLFINTIGMILTNNFYVFLILFIIEGLSIALRSGSDRALIYDSLKLLGKENDYIKISSQISAISLIILGISIGLGGYMAEINWNFIYLFYAIMVFFASICVIFIYEKIEDFKSIKNPQDIILHNANEIKQAIAFLKSKTGKNLLLFLLPVAILDGVLTPYYIYGQNLFNYFDISAKNISLIYCCLCLFSGVMNLFANKISKLLELKKLLSIVLLLTSLLMISNIASNFILSLIVLFLIVIATDIVDILINNFIQQKITSNIRASLFSIKGFLGSAFVGLAYISFAKLFDLLGIIITYALMGILPIISLIFFVYYYKLASKN